MTNEEKHLVTLVRIIKDNLYVIEKKIGKVKML